MPKGVITHGGGGKQGTLRRRWRDNIEGINNPAIRRVARRAGVKVIAGPIYEHARRVVRQHLGQLLRRTLLLTQHAKRKTVSVKDVLRALQHEHQTVYGFGSTI